MEPVEDDTRLTIAEFGLMESKGEDLHGTNDTLMGSLNLSFASLIGLVAGKRWRGKIAIEHKAQEKEAS